MQTNLCKIKSISIFFLMLVGIFFGAVPCWGVQKQKASGPEDVLIVSGTITNAQGKEVGEAIIDFFIDGKKVALEDELFCENRGTYKASLYLPSGILSVAKVAMTVKKPCYEDRGPVPLARIVKERRDDKGSTFYLAHQNVLLKRIIGPAFWIATSVLILVYGLIALEVMHRTLGACGKDVSITDIPRRIFPNWCSPRRPP